MSLVQTPPLMNDDFYMLVQFRVRQVQIFGFAFLKTQVGQGQLNEELDSEVQFIGERGLDTQNMEELISIKISHMGDTESLNVRG